MELRILEANEMKNMNNEYTMNKTPRYFQTITVLFFVLIAATALAQTGMQSVLLPDMSYSVTIKKTISGNDGIKDIIPSVSTQTVSIETGEAEGKGLPVHLLINTAQRIDEKGKLLPSQMEWNIRFLLAPDGSLSAITAVSNEGELPEVFVRSIIIRQLSEILFQPVYAFEMKNKPVVEILSMKNLPERASEIKYRIASDVANTESDVAQGMVRESEGMASFDFVNRFFPKRIHQENTRMFIASDGVQEEHTVIMVVKTEYNVRADQR